MSITRSITRPLSRPLTRSLNGDSAGGGDVQPPGPEVTTLEVDGETFTFSPATQAGVSLDGIGWVKWVDGLQITSRSTAPSTIQNHAEDTTYAINGTMKNPSRLDYTVSQGWDQRAGGYNGSNNVSYPISVAAGDTIWAAVGSNHVLGQPGAPSNEIREGVVSKYIALHIVSEEWGANVIAPTGFHWTGKTEQQPFAINLTSFINFVSSRGPSSQAFSLTFVDYMPVSEFIDNLDRLEPWGYTSANSGTNGYETLTTRHRADVGESNYGGYLRYIEEAAALHLIGNVATTEQKERIALALIRNGIQFYDAVKGSGFKVRGEGAHSAWQLFCVVTALYATGREDELEDLPSVMGTNALTQPFIVDQDFLDTLAPHDNTSLPHSYRRREITAVSGNNITVEYSRSGSVGDVAQMNWSKLRLKRESDGATAIITTTSSTYRAPEDTNFTFAIEAQPGSPFAVGNVVFVETPVPLSVGDPEWLIDPELPHAYNPSPSQAYRPTGVLNRWGGAVIYTKALGSIPDQTNWNALVDYVVESHEVDYPSATFDFPSAFGPCRTYQTAPTFWTIHAANLGFAAPGDALIDPFRVNGAFFVSPSGPSANTTKAVFSCKFRFLEATVTNDVIFRQRSSSQFRFNASRQGNISAVEDGAGTAVTLGATAISHQFDLGVVYELVVSIDMVAQVITVTINGTLAETLTMTVTEAQRFFQTGQGWSFFSANGTTAAFPASTEVEYAALTTTTSGVDTEVFRIDTKEMTIAEINSHAWKLGADIISGDVE